jgi:hypothetical protein
MSVLGKFRLFLDEMLQRFRRNLDHLRLEPSIVAHSGRDHRTEAPLHREKGGIRCVFICTMESVRTDFHEFNHELLARANCLI